MKKLEVVSQEEIKSSPKKTNDALEQEIETKEVSSQTSNKSSDAKTNVMSSIQRNTKSSEQFSSKEIKNVTNLSLKNSKSTTFFREEPFTIVLKKESSHKIDSKMKPSTDQKNKSISLSVKTEIFEKQAISPQSTVDIENKSSIPEKEKSILPSININSQASALGKKAGSPPVTESSSKNKKKASVSPIYKAITDVFWKRSGSDENETASASDVLNEEKEINSSQSKTNVGTSILSKKMGSYASDANAEISTLKSIKEKDISPRIKIMKSSVPKDETVSPIESNFESISRKEESISPQKKANTEASILGKNSVSYEADAKIESYTHKEKENISPLKTMTEVSALKRSPTINTNLDLLARKGKKREIISPIIQKETDRSVYERKSESPVIEGEDESFSNKRKKAYVSPDIRTKLGVPVSGNKIAKADSFANKMEAKCTSLQEKVPCFSKKEEKFVVESKENFENSEQADFETSIGKTECKGIKHAIITDKNGNIESFTSDTDKDAEINKNLKTPSLQKTSELLKQSRNKLKADVSTQTAENITGLKINSSGKKNQKIVILKRSDNLQNPNVSQRKHALKAPFDPKESRKSTNHQAKGTIKIPESPKKSASPRNDTNIFKKPETCKISLRTIFKDFGTPKDIDSSSPKKCTHVEIEKKNFLQIRQNLLKQYSSERSRLKKIFAEAHSVTKFKNCKTVAVRAAKLQEKIDQSLLKLSENEKNKREHEQMKKPSKNCKTISKAFDIRLETSTRICSLYSVFKLLNATTETEVPEETVYSRLDSSSLSVSYKCFSKVTEENFSEAENVKDAIQDCLRIFPYSSIECYLESQHDFRMRGNIGDLELEELNTKLSQQLDASLVEFLNLQQIQGELFCYTKNYISIWQKIRNHYTAFLNNNKKFKNN
ncbi:hypothetical protein CDAR_409981 [Caerostris darwini]|uniref:Uncharacterized protein n=1 Tax=Caerostris darwini TaxID=1538125 RepID=A0AAV4VW88_9ARAC|nr:hypothetical protein CDAR_409981 [Caerostris darwini]